jgi:hypothetical protein
VSADRVAEALAALPAWDAPDDLDPECLSLCRAMNAFSGITTTCSCAGHLLGEFAIWFRAATLDALPALLYYTSQCHTGVKGWRVEVSTDCAMSPVTFTLYGPPFDVEGADGIALAMATHGR